MAKQQHASDEAVQALELQVTALRAGWRGYIEEGDFSPRDDDFYRARTWSLVAEALDLQLGHGKCAALDLCAWRFSDVVTEVERQTHKGRTFDDKLSEWVTATLQERVMPPRLSKFNDDSVADKVDCFNNLEESYQHIKASMAFAAILFKDRSSTASLRDVFLKPCRTVVKGRLVTVLVEEVNAQREGTKPPSHLAALQACWRTYVDLDTTWFADRDAATQNALFREDVEAPYIAALLVSYGKAQRPVDAGYLAWVDERITFELSLLTEVFFAHSEQVVPAVAAALVTPYRDEIINHPKCGFAALLNAWDKAALVRMYSLMQRYDKDALRRMCDALQQHLVVKALPVSGTQATWALLLSVKSTYEKYTKLIHDLFHDDARFHGALNAAVGTFLCAVGAPSRLFEHWSRARVMAAHADATILKFVAELLLASASEAYTMEFTAQFQAALADFYQATGATELQKDLRWLASHLDFELWALPRGTYVDAELSRWVMSSFATLVRANAASLLQERDEKYLRRLYALAKRHSEALLHAMGEALHARVVEEGTQMLRDFEDAPPDAVPPIVELNTKYDQVIADCCENNVLLLEYLTLGMAAVLQLPVKTVKGSQASCEGSAQNSDQTVLTAVANAARCDSSATAASALKATAELFLHATADYETLEEQYWAAFSAFYGTRAVDSHWLARQLDFEIAAMPSKGSSVYRKIMAHFVTAVTNVVATTALPLLQASAPLHAELSRLYALSKRLKSEAPLHAMGKALQARIVEEGTQLLRDLEAATSDRPLPLEKPLVTAMIGLDKKYGNFIAECFDNDTLLLNYRKLGFAEVLKVPLKRKDPKPCAAADHAVVRETETSFSEVLATFLDAVMRQLEQVATHDVDAVFLDDLLTVFTYITEKDVFQELYRLKLARRLLQTTPNEDLEKGFLERLQREMGKSFTHKMEGMLLDRDSSRALAEKFAQDSSRIAGLGVGFEVRVLTAANWPAFKTDNLQPPLSLQRCVDAFTRFYKKAHPTRQLTWISALGSASLTVLFPKGTKDVTATLHQASVLVLVDEAGQLSVRALAEALGLDAPALKPHVASMYMSKFPLLHRMNTTGVKTAEKSSIGDDDLFAMNLEFTHSTRKFRLPALVTKGDDASVDPIPIDANRKLQIDATVVRIMKSHKTLSYAVLQDAAINMLSKYFMAQPKMVKARVEDLITRDYLKRHDADPKVLEYLA